MTEKSVHFYLSREDPLTREAALFLIAYDEEDDRVDYKKIFDSTSDREWLEITKDVSSFSNTHGGYLVFGVRDSDKKLVGLTQAVATTLKDVNLIHQKVNRHLEPEISLLRSKAFRIENNTIVVWYIPQSSGITHLVCKDGTFKYPTGKEKTILHKGTFYIRRSASNHLADSRDLDETIERRVDQFRDSLLDKIATVVKAPPSSDLFILSKDPEDADGKRFIIEDSPDAIVVKGMSFTVAPDGPEEEIAAWTSLSGDSSKNAPPPLQIWKWYAVRDQIEVGESHKVALFRFSLWSSVPSFFWIQGMKSSVIRNALISAVRNRPPATDTKQMLITAAFLGKGVYSTILKALGSYIDRIAPAMRAFPTDGPRTAFVTIGLKPRQTKAQLRKEQLAKLNEISEVVIEKDKLPALTKRWKAQEIDCFLYVQDDQYK